VFSHITAEYRGGQAKGWVYSWEEGSNTTKGGGEREKYPKKKTSF